jgi:hypothetical protein
MKGDPFQSAKPSALSLKVQRSHMEPDPDESGGASDNDSDNTAAAKNLAKVKKMLASKRRRK